MSYPPHALGTLQILLLRNLKKDFKKHGSFEEQIDYWVDLVRDKGLDPEVDPFANSIMAVSELYRRHRSKIDDMHRQMAEVLTLLADPGETGDFEWSNCDFVTFKDVLKIAGRSELGTLSLREIRKALGLDGPPRA